MFHSFSRLPAAFFAAISLLVLAGCGGGGVPGLPSGGSTPPPPPSCQSPVPAAPTIWAGTSGNGSATVYFSANSSTLYITSYTLTANPGNISVSLPGTAISGLVTGLTNGTTYTFTVTANSCAGASPASNSTTVTPVGPPAAPTTVTATAGAAVASASVGFTPPTNNGGSAITSYTVTSTPGNITATGTTSPVQVLGLSNGVSYTFTVKANNFYGSSAASTASNALTVTIPYTGPFYVNGVTGLDSNTGALATPFKTITQGLAVARAVGTANTINVAAATYSTGETFPLKMLNNVNIVGAGSGTTIVSGNGYYTPSGTITSYGATLVFPPAVTSTVSGLTLQYAWDATVIVDSATATLTSNFMNGPIGASDGIYILSASNVGLTGNTITGGCWRLGGLYVSGHPSVVGRTNNISAGATCNLPAVAILGAGTSLSSPVVDLGTSTPASPGGNTITGGSAGVGMSVTNTLNVVNASGNTWHPNIQGANASGIYATGTLATNPTAVGAGNNYAISGSTNLQF
jgi:hypothetical protein